MDVPARSRDDRPSDAALEIGRLVLELIHATYAAEEPGPGARSGTGIGAVHSPHAIRAAIHVYQHGERTIGELGEGLGISMGWASRVVSELEASGLVVRATDPDDRRVTRVSLTPTAVEVVEHAYRWRADAIDEALEPLDDAGRAAVRRFLALAVAALTEAGRERRASPR